MSQNKLVNTKEVISYKMVKSFFTKDQALGVNERALLTTMLLLPNDWDISIRNLMREIPMSKGLVSRTLQRLIDKKYVARKKSKEKENSYIYETSDTPIGASDKKLKEILLASNYNFNSDELDGRVKELYEEMLLEVEQYLSEEFESGNEVDGLNEISIEDVLEELAVVEAPIEASVGVEMVEVVTEVVEAPIKPTKAKKRAYEGGTPKKAPKKDANLLDLVTKYTDDYELRDALDGFIEMRKTIKSPLTERAMIMIFNKLDKECYTTDEKIDTVNRSIVNNWKDVYPNKAQVIQPKKNNSVSFMDLD